MHHLFYLTNKNKIIKRNNKKPKKNLIPKESILKRLEKGFDIDIYLSDLQKDKLNNNTLTNYMWRLILQQGYFKINVGNELAKYQSDIAEIKHSMIKCYRQHKKFFGSEVKSIFESFKLTNSSDPNDQRYYYCDCSVIFRNFNFNYLKEPSNIII